MKRVDAPQATPSSAKNNETNSRSPVRPSIALALAGALCLAAYPYLKGWYQDFSRSRLVSDMRNLSLVAHAGGRPMETHRPNSLAAMEASYARGHRYFEIDLLWTADGVLVGAHHWESNIPPTFEELNANPALLGSIMTIEEACQWHRSRRDTYMLTDGKTYRFKILEVVKQLCGTSRIIPQVHNRIEYQKARRLGFKNIVITLYRAESHPDYSWEKYIDRTLLGITIPVEVLHLYDLSRLPAGSCTGTHTVNSETEFRTLRARGICAIQSDILMPDDHQQR